MDCERRSLEADALKLAVQTAAVLGLLNFSTQAPRISLDFLNPTWYSIRNHFTISAYIYKNLVLVFSVVLVSVVWKPFCSRIRQRCFPAVILICCAGIIFMSSMVFLPTTGLGFFVTGVSELMVSFGFNFAYVMHMLKISVVASKIRDSLSLWGKPLRSYEQIMFCVWEAIRNLAYLLPVSFFFVGRFLDPRAAISEDFLNCTTVISSYNNEPITRDLFRYNESDFPPVLSWYDLFPKPVIIESAYQSTILLALVLACTAMVFMTVCLTGCCSCLLKLDGVEIEMCYTSFVKFFCCQTKFKIIGLSCICNGLLESFVFNDYLQTNILDNGYVYHLPAVLILYSLSGSLVCTLVAMMNTQINRVSVMTWTCLLHVLVITFLIVQTNRFEGVACFYIVMGLLGATITVWRSQLAVTTAVICSVSKIEAYTSLMLYHYLAYLISSVGQPFLGLSTKLYILLGVAIVAQFLYYWNELQVRVTQISANTTGKRERYFCKAKRLTASTVSTIRVTENDQESIPLQLADTNCNPAAAEDTEEDTAVDIESRSTVVTRISAEEA